MLREFLDIPELSGKHVGLLKEIVPRLSRIAIFGIPGLNTLQFKATEMAARASMLRPSLMEVRIPDDFKGAMEAGERDMLKPVSYCHPLSYSSLRGKSASLRWPNGFPSFLCSMPFQRTAGYWLMGRV